MGENIVCIHVIKNHLHFFLGFLVNWIQLLQKFVGL